MAPQLSGGMLYNNSIRARYAGHANEQSINSLLFVVVIAQTIVKLNKNTFNLHFWVVLHLTNGHQRCLQNEFWRAPSLLVEYHLADWHLVDARCLKRLFDQMTSHYYRPNTVALWRSSICWPNVGWSNVFSTKRRGSKLYAKKIPWQVDIWACPIKPFLPCLYILAHL